MKLTTLVDKALEVQVQLNQLSEVLASYKEKVKAEMEKQNIVKLEQDSGLATYVVSKAADRFDEKKLAKLLGEKINRYKVPGKPFSFVRFTPHQ